MQIALTERQERTLITGVQGAGVQASTTPIEGSWVDSAVTFSCTRCPTWALDMATVWVKPLRDSTLASPDAVSYNTVKATAPSTCTCPWDG